MTGKPETFLNLIHRSTRGKFKIYLGFAPGVGKTWQMLQEAQALKANGVRVALGAIETHGRKETAALLEGLDVIPPRVVEYRGIRLVEMDLDAVLARRPEVVLVDELPHTNAPGSKNQKRYQDIMEILHAGIHVISAMNIQHLESLYNTIERLVGLKVTERVPDFILAEADQVIHVDLAVEDLQSRLAKGQIYDSGRIPTAFQNYFQSKRLSQLRELALWETASRLEQQHRHQGSQEIALPEQVAVALGGDPKVDEALLRYGSRLAGRLHRKWFALHVQTPGDNPLRIPAERARRIGQVLALANELGATVFTLHGENVAETLLRFCEENAMGHLVIGKPKNDQGPLRRLRRKWFGHSGVADLLLDKARGLSLVFFEESIQDQSPPQMTVSSKARGSGGIWQTEKIWIIESPQEKAQILKRLVELALSDDPASVEAAYQGVLARESIASTFLNEGIALPHTRLAVDSPRVAFALLREGIKGESRGTHTEWVILMITPLEHGPGHLTQMSRMVRAFQNRDLRRQIRKATEPVHIKNILEKGY